VKPWTSRLNLKVASSLLEFQGNRMQEFRLGAKPVVQIVPKSTPIAFEQFECPPGDGAIKFSQ
jgi:hypothetical protein